MSSSIFQRYFGHQSFVDRYQIDGNNAVDVIIPVIHTNELWRQNLISIYREIPVYRLIIADGGCLDDSVKIASQFPRVTILNHRQIMTLGYSLRKLIENVETEWFVYLHSDVYLPEGWFDAMSIHRRDYDWIECRPVLTTLVEIELDHSKAKRPFSGAQLGCLKSFEKVLPKIEDDYLYRNEDIILAELLQNSGGRYTRVCDVFHYHQEMKKSSPWERRVKSVRFEWEMSKDEEERADLMQVKGIVKYLNPRDDIPLDHYGYLSAIRHMKQAGNLDLATLEQWIGATDKNWLMLHRRKLHEERLRILQQSIYDAWMALKEYVIALW